MAARLTGKGWLAVALTAALFIACTAPIEQPSVAPVATPHVEITPAIDAARSALAVRLRGHAFTLTQANGYEPGEPANLQTAAHAVFQLNLAGPNEGWVVVYDLGTADAAIAAGNDFATYLQRSGHSNYPSDSQFSLTSIGSALVFHWYAASRASDVASASDAFAIVSAVGQKIDVVD